MILCGYNLGTNFELYPAAASITASRLLPIMDGVGNHHEGASTKEKVLKDYGEARITVAVLKYYFHASSEYRASSDEKVAAEALKRRWANWRSDRMKK